MYIDIEENEILANKIREVGKLFYFNDSESLIEASLMDSIGVMFVAYASTVVVISKSILVALDSIPIISTEEQGRYSFEKRVYSTDFSQLEALKVSDCFIIRSTSMLRLFPINGIELTLPVGLYSYLVESIL